MLAGQPGAALPRAVSRGAHQERHRSGGHARQGNTVIAGNCLGILSKIPLAQRDGELRGGLVLQMVCFVDDEGVIVRQNAVTRRRIGQQ